VAPLSQAPTPKAKTSTQLLSLVPNLCAFASLREIFLSLVAALPRCYLLFKICLRDPVSPRDFPEMLKTAGEQYPAFDPKAAPQNA
jgi:hypothetical protein